METDYPLWGCSPKMYLLSFLKTRTKMQKKISHIYLTQFEL